MSTTARARVRLLAAMRRHNIQLKEPPIFDGKFRNVDALGDAPNSKKAWYWLPADCRYGAFGHHRPDVNERINLSGDKPLSRKKLRTLRKEFRAEMKRHDAKQAASRQRCRERATQIWEKAVEPSPDHPYLVKKGVKAFGIRQHGNSLVIPVRGSDGMLHGLQFISPANKKNKKYLTATRKRGSCFLICGPVVDRLIVVEGYATGATVHEAVGIPVACAFDAGNLEYVADELRRLYPRVEITIAADNDAETERKGGTNPGLVAARDAAKAIGARLTWPHFEQVKKSMADFNDLMRVKGIGAVREALSVVEDYSGWPPPITATGADPHTDLANSERFAKAFGRYLLYAHGRGWLEFGPPWRQSRQAAENCAKLCGQLARGEAAATELTALESDDERDTRQAAADLRAWAKKSESLGRINAALKLSESLLGIPGARLDSQMRLLGFPNGVLDVNTHVFRAHRASDFISSTYGCRYDPDAKAPRFRKFLKELLPGDPGVIRFIQTVFGYALLGRQKEHIVVMFYGEGRNGKGALLRAIRHVFGDYAIAAPQSLLVASGQRHPAELAVLAGRRLVIHGETNAHAVFDTSKLKILTGNDPISARGMHKDFGEFIPSHVLLMHTNHLLRVVDKTKAFWDRLKVVPFNAEFDAKDEPKLEDTLKAEACGILNWMLTGLRRYQKNGLKIPKTVRTATATYRRQQDDVGLFLVKCCYRKRHSQESLNVLYARFVQWFEASRVGTLISKTAFATELAQLGCPRKKGTAGARFHMGLRLRRK